MVAYVSCVGKTRRHVGGKRNRRADEEKMKKYRKVIGGIAFLVYKALALNIIWTGINETVDRNGFAMIGLIQTSPDWFGLYPILRQVPRDAFIQISGWHTYWFCK